MQKLTREDFSYEGDSWYKASMELWGESISLEVQIEAEEKEVEDYLSCMEDLLDWMENNKDKIQEVICEEMLEDANDWTEGCDSQIIDGIEYFETDVDELVTLPVTKEQFIKSMYFNANCIELDIKNQKEYTLCICIDTKPNYFGGHSILVLIDENHNIDIRFVG